MKLYRCPYCNCDLAHDAEGKDSYNNPSHWKCLAEAYRPYKRDWETSQAECERLRAAADGAENALRCCPALKEWGPSTPEHLASRVAALCNLYDGTMYTITLLDDLEQQWKQSTACASPEEAGRVIADLRADKGLLDSGRIRLLRAGLWIDQDLRACIRAALSRTAKQEGADDQGESNGH